VHREPCQSPPGFSRHRRPARAPRLALALCVAGLVSVSACRSGGSGHTDPPVSDERCTPGVAGCVCADGTECRDGSACFYGACFASPGQRPDSYYYSQQNLDDEMVINTLVQAQVPIAAGAQVADIGAGAGFYTIHAARKVGAAGKVYATDIDQGRLDSIASMVERLPDGADLRPRIALRLVRDMAGTALEDLPPASLDLVVMLRVLTFRPESRPADLAYLRGIANLVKPGGRFVYHMDWVPETGYREHLEALFRDAGFSGATDEIAMPPHIPETTDTFDWSLVARPKITLRRGFILVFHR
jgi:SAM-dependent methyltransferase